MNDSKNSQITPKYVIIDTDGGIDDALALMLASHAHREGLIRLLAVTCCFGNTAIDNVVRNVAHILHVCDVQNVKIYKGCEFAIVSEPIDASSYHGVDGLGGASHELPHIDITLEEEHSVNALIKYVKQFPKQITIIALGPLTNLALAHLIYPQLLSNISHIYSMGGNITANGNFTASAEFNYYSDPEAAHLVLSNANSILTILPWETCLTHLVTKDMYNKIISVNSTKAKFFERITRARFREVSDDQQSGVTLCDALAVIAVIYPQVVCETVMHSSVRVELNGLLTRGQLVVDRRRQNQQSLTSDNITFITKYIQSKVTEIMIKSME